LRRTDSHAIPLERVIEITNIFINARLDDSVCLTTRVTTETGATGVLCSFDVHLASLPKQQVLPARTRATVPPGQTMVGQRANEMSLRFGSFCCRLFRGRSLDHLAPVGLRPLTAHCGAPIPMRFH